jgi:hypothetical protein
MKFGLLCAAALIVVVACEPSRSRPGPPRVTIDIPNGTSVFSPDSFVVNFSAVDDDGLDSLVLRWRTLIFDINTEFRVEASASRTLLVPPGLPPGATLLLRVGARDLVGQTTEEFRTITVLGRPQS